MIKIKAHPTADISPKAKIGDNTRIWHQVQIRENTVIGKNCILGKSVYIDKNVMIGDNCKIQNFASIYSGSILKDGVFIGPYACLLNDKKPRAVAPSGILKKEKDWACGKILVKKGSSIGAGAIILPGITLGQFSLIGAGSLVTKSIPDFGMAFGNPARLKGFVCKCGHKLEKKENRRRKFFRMECLNCGEKISIKEEHYKLLGK